MKYLIQLSEQRNCIKFKNMIKGNRKTNLVYSTRHRDRSSILSVSPEDDSLVRRKERMGKLVVNTAEYRYDPSKQYRSALDKYHTVPKKRVIVNRY